MYITFTALCRAAASEECVDVGSGPGAVGSGFRETDSVPNCLLAQRWFVFVIVTTVKIKGGVKSH